jgi:hypothetical protein
MRNFYVSMTRDLLGVYIEYRADSEKAVRLYLEKKYMRSGIWMLPWCAVYTAAPTGAVIVKAQCGQIYEADYTYTCHPFKAKTRAFPSTDSLLDECVTCGHLKTHHYHEVTR